MSLSRSTLGAWVFVTSLFVGGFVSHSWSITTPRGTEVTCAFTRGESDCWPAGWTVTMADNYIWETYVVPYGFESVTSQIAPSTCAYNCHGYAWHKWRTDEEYWIDECEDIYISDRSYIFYGIPTAGSVVDCQTDGMICHYARSTGFDEHSAIVLSTTDVVGKWGNGPVYQHPWDHTFYMDYTTSYAVYQPNSNPIEHRDSVVLIR